MIFTYGVYSLNRNIIYMPEELKDTRIYNFILKHEFKHWENHSKKSIFKAYLSDLIDEYKDIPLKIRYINEIYDYEEENKNKVIKTPLKSIPYIIIYNLGRLPFDLLLNIYILLKIIKRNIEDFGEYLIE